MIGLLTQNNLYAMTLVEILKETGVEIAIKDGKYEAYLLVAPWPEKVPVGKYITLGGHIAGETVHIDTPVHPDVLMQKMKQFSEQQMNAITFENTGFVFQKDKRLLIDKENDSTISLTEKENELLSVLSEASPEALSKEELLRRVWNYKPDLETHTLESHIYGLRQKIGGHADALFRSTDAGYQMIID